MTRIFLAVALFFSVSTMAYFEIELHTDFSKSRSWRSQLADLIQTKHPDRFNRYCAAVVSEDFTVVKYDFYNSETEANQGVFAVADSFAKQGLSFHVFQLNLPLFINEMTGIFLE